MRALAGSVHEFLSAVPRRARRACEPGPPTRFQRVGVGGSGAGRKGPRERPSRGVGRSPTLVRDSRAIRFHPVGGAVVIGPGGPALRPASARRSLDEGAAGLVSVSKVPKLRLDPTSSTSRIGESSSTRRPRRGAAKPACHPVGDPGWHGRRDTVKFDTVDPFGRASTASGFVDTGCWL